MQPEIKKGTQEAMKDFLSLKDCARLGERPLDMVREGVKDAFADFLKKHEKEIIEAIKEGMPHER